jgi:predicted phage tail component-like protein
MFNLTLENSKGEQIILTNRETEYQIIDVMGLEPPKATITSSTLVGLDGAKFQSSRLEERNIVIKIRINGQVAENRNRLYRYVKAKQYCKVIYKDELHNVFAEGHIDTIECPLFTNSEIMQISIVCHDPYLQSLVEIISNIAYVLGNFEFPFSFGASGIIPDTKTDSAIEFGEIDSNPNVNIFNEGGDTGLIIDIQVSGGGVLNPALHNVYTRESFRLNITLQDGDVVTLNTKRGEKSVTLLRHGTKQNILNHMAAGSIWLQLYEGDNIFTCSADEGAEFMFTHWKHRVRFEGV